MSLKNVFRLSRQYECNSLDITLEPSTNHVTEPLLLEPSLCDSNFCFYFFLNFWLKKFIYIADIKKYEHLNYKVQNNYLFIKNIWHEVYITNNISSAQMREKNSFEVKKYRFLIRIWKSREVWDKNRYIEGRGYKSEELMINQEL